jgi:hypothetical protein
VALGSPGLRAGKSPAFLAFRGLAWSGRSRMKKPGMRILATNVAKALPDIIVKAELIRQDEQRVVGWSKSADFSVPGLLALRRVRH